MNFKYKFSEVRIVGNPRCSCMTSYVDCFFQLRFYPIFHRNPHLFFKQFCGFFYELVCFREIPTCQAHVFVFSDKNISYLQLEIDFNSDMGYGMNPNVLNEHNRLKKGEQKTKGVNTNPQIIFHCNVAFTKGVLYENVVGKD